MPKVSLNIKMNTNGEERNHSLKGIKDNNKIKYIDDDNHIEVDFLNKGINIDNEDYNIRLTFDINAVKILDYKLKKVNKGIVLNIKTNKLEIDNNKFIVDYELLDDESTITHVSYELYILED